MKVMVFIAFHLPIFLSGTVAHLRRFPEITACFLERIVFGFLFMNYELEKVLSITKLFL